MPKPCIPQSAEDLKIKSIMILPIDRDFFLYVDSGTQFTLDHSEKELIRMLGSLLTEAIQKIRKSQEGSGGISGQSDAMGNLNLDRSEYKKFMKFIHNNRFQFTMIPGEKD